MEKSNKYGVCYPVEYFNPHVHLEYNNDNYTDLNEAEIKALQYEEYKNKNNENKKLKNQEFKNKYSINLVQYQEELKMKNKEEEAIKQKEKTEKLNKNKNINKTVFEKNMKPFSLRNKNAKSLNRITKATNNKNKKHLKEVKVVNHSNENINLDLNEDNNNNNNDNEFEKFVPKKRLLKSNNNPFYSDNLDNNDFVSKNNLNVNENIYEEKMDNNLNIDINKNNEKDKKNINLNENIVDLRGNIEEQLLEELKNKKKYHNNNEINDEINEKISNIKRFRNHGFLPPQNEFVEEKKAKKKSKNKKFFSEFERKRFIKALKHIITERLGEHNIYIQNICNCGNLQKQLTALVEKGNLTVYALTEVDCANNCVFYKNKKAYLKSINDVLDSIKDIAYENFHNKYKD